jgi:hypothetical protein
MKRDEVKIGNVYAVKVSGNIQPVRLSRVVMIEKRKLHGFPGWTQAFGGWIGRNEITDREVRVRSAAKLRYPLVYSAAKGWHRFKSELVDRVLSEPPKVQ